jgi:hypothetical protein
MYVAQFNASIVTFDVAAVTLTLGSMQNSSQKALKVKKSWRYIPDLSKRPNDPVIHDPEYWVNGKGPTDGEGSADRA